MKRYLLLTYVLSIITFELIYAQCNKDSIHVVKITNTLKGIYFTDSKTGYAISKDSSIAKTIDSGRIWVKQNAPSFDYFRIRFNTSNVGYAVGNNGVIVKTTDGSNWHQLSINSHDLFTNVCFFKNNVGYVIGYHSVFKSSDGGNTWATVTPPKPKFCPNLNRFSSGYFVNPDTGFVFAVYTDYSVCKLPNCPGYQYGLIHKTFDGGNSWTYDSLPNAYACGYDITFVNNQKGFIAGYYNTIYSTENGGRTWAINTVNPIAPDSYISVSFTDSNNGILVGFSGTILKTNDGGSNWYQVGRLSYPLQESFLLGSYYIDSIAYVVGLTDTILRIGCPPHLSTAISSIISYNDLSLYPNPSNGNFTLNPGRPFNYQVKISNSIGQQIFSRSGNDVMDINLPDINSGVYYVQVLSESRNITRKMVITY